MWDTVLRFHCLINWKNVWVERSHAPTTPGCLGIFLASHSQTVRFCALMFWMVLDITCGLIDTLLWQYLMIMEVFLCLSDSWFLPLLWGVFHVNSLMLSIRFKFLYLFPFSYFYSSKILASWEFYIQYVVCYCVFMLIIINFHFLVVARDLQMLTLDLWSSLWLLVFSLFLNLTSIIKNLCWVINIYPEIIL